LNDFGGIRAPCQTSAKSDPTKPKKSGRRREKLDEFRRPIASIAQWRSGPGLVSMLWRPSWQEKVRRRTARVSTSRVGVARLGASQTHI
jgi:hypothetical protein